jgi:hypothetical protein
MGVIPTLGGVPIARALLLIAVHLTDETVDVDHQALVTGSGASSPRAGDQQAQTWSKFADIPERERAQKRPQRRRGHRTVPEQRLGASSAQDAQSSMQSAPSNIANTSDSTLRPGRAAPRDHPGAPCGPPTPRSQPPRQRHREHDPRVLDHPLVVKHNSRSVRRIVHHAGDLLMQDPQSLPRPVLPAQEVS